MSEQMNQQQETMADVMQQRNTPTGPTKVCKYCQTTIPKKAKICPQCRKKQKKPILLWIVIAIIVIAFFSSLGGSEDGDKTAKKTGTVDSSKQEATKESGNKDNTDGAKEETVTNNFKPGDVVETDQFKISYVSAGEYTESNEFMQPKDGNTYYRMEFEFENVSDTDQTISSMVDWTCYADGYAADQYYGAEDDIDKSLSPGKKAKGAVYFEVPKESKEITLEYETSFWTQDKIIFVVK